MKYVTDVKGEYIVKAQILAGGRGKGTFIDTGFKGGVQFAKTPAEVKSFAEKMIGHTLKTHQTAPEGVPVTKVLVAECIDIKRECYLAIVMDRSAKGPVMVASQKGGMDIEKVAAEDPAAIFSEPIDIKTGLKPEQAQRLATALGFSGEKAKSACRQMENMYKMFCKTDALQIEINPFAETTDGRVVCIDAKIGFDENAAFRQKEIFALHDPELDDPREARAAKAGLNYIGLDGSIGCMVNGAGLAMATLDIISLNGGKAANFLDVGGGATEAQVTEAFKILTADTKVKAILVNIFGGIMRCDIIANGILAAAKTVGVKVPLVVRLSGTNSDLGKKIIRESGLNIVAASDLDEAARLAVKSIQPK